MSSTNVCSQTGNPAPRMGILVDCQPFNARVPKATPVSAPTEVLPFPAARVGRRFPLVGAAALGLVFIVSVTVGTLLARQGSEQSVEIPGSPSAKTTGVVRAVPLSNPVGVLPLSA